MENAASSESSDKKPPACLTVVEEIYIERRKNYRLLFGKPLRSITKQLEYGKITRKVHFFKPGSVFALDLWDCNDHGTTQWSVFVLEAALPGELAQTVPQVHPGAKVLLDARGQKNARAALRELKDLEERLVPTTLPANYFLLTDFRLKDAPLPRETFPNKSRKRA